MLAQLLSNKYMFLIFIYSKVLVFQEKKNYNLGPFCLLCHLCNRTPVCIFPQFYVYISFLLPPNVFPQPRNINLGAVYSSVI